MKVCIRNCSHQTYASEPPQVVPHKASGQSIRACLGSWVSLSLDVGKCFVLWPLSQVKVVLILRLWK